MYSLQLQVGFQRQIEATGFFHYHRKTGYRTEMAGVQSECLLDVCQRQSKFPHVEEDRGPRIPAFGELRGVVGKGRNVFQGCVPIACFHRVAAALQQKVHRIRAGLRPLCPDFPFDGACLAVICGLKRFEKLINPFAVGESLRRKKHYREKCRNGTFESCTGQVHNIFECSVYDGKCEFPKTKTQDLNMSKVIDGAVEALNAKLSGGFDGIAKFVIEGEGSILVDGDGARASDDDAEVTLTADQETFQAMMEGDLNPTAAFMQGKLSVDGDMGAAMRLGAILS